MQINRVIRGMLALLVCYLPITSCTVLLGPHEFVDCVQQSDCQANQACSAGGRCYCPKLSFRGPWAPPAYPTGKRPSSVAALDLNGDGKPDLAVANEGGDAMYTDGSVSVLLGKGDGTFQPQVTYPTGKRPSAVAALDLNRDGKPDLVVVNRLGDAMNPLGSVSVLLGNGDGTFKPQVIYATGTFPYAIAALDLNGDGKLDLAVTSNGDVMHPEGSVCVLLGKGDGTFQPQVTYATGHSPSSVAALDLNGDGKPDLAVTNVYEGDDNMNRYGSVSVLLGNGDGTFQPQVTYLVGDRPLSVAALDLNGDGKPDLVVSGDAGNVGVLLGNGDGTFQPEVTYVISLALYAIAALDLNGDGKPDLAVTRSLDNSVSVLLNYGNGTFDPKFTTDPYVYPAGSLTGAIAALDLNGDGKPDLAVATYGGDVMHPEGSVSVLLGNGDGTFQPQVTSRTGNFPYAIAALDLNGDGKPDLAVTTYNYNGDVIHPDGSVSVLLGNGDGTFQPQVAYATGFRPSSVAALDLNGDGKPDLAVANAGGDAMHPDGSVSVLLGNGDGTFQPQVTYATGKEPSSVAALDLNGDGKPDLAIANSNDGSMSVLLGKGDGTFQPQVTYATGDHPSSVAALDLNGDGKPDLAVTTRYVDAMNPDGSVSVLLGKGDGAFKAPVMYPTGIWSRSVLALDLDGDGKPDLAVANYSDSTMSVLLNRGDGTFQPQGAYPTGKSPRQIVALDLNGDGKPDLAATTHKDNSMQSEGSVSVLLNICLP